MNRIVIAAIAATIASAASAQPNVAVAVGQPGYYGRIDIGGYPSPALIYPQPVLIEPVTPGGLVREPIYLHVPPAQAKNWRENCHWYGACGSPVYFVQDAWYQQVYVPRHRGMYDPGRAQREWNGGGGGGFGTQGFGRGRRGDGWNN